MDRDSEDGTPVPSRYSVGIDAGSEDAARFVESRAVSIHNRIELGSVRTVLVGTFTAERLEEVRTHPGVAYVERDEGLEAHEEGAESPSDGDGDG